MRSINTQQAVLEYPVDGLCYGGDVAAFCSHCARRLHHGDAMCKPHERRKRCSCTVSIRVSPTRKRLRLRLRLRLQYCTVRLVAYIRLRLRQRQRQRQRAGFGQVRRGTHSRAHPAARARPKNKAIANQCEPRHIT